jgi:hypothetical protein
MPQDIDKAIDSALEYLRDAEDADGDAQGISSRAFLGHTANAFLLRAVLVELRTISEEVHALRIDLEVARLKG